MSTLVSDQVDERSADTSLALLDLLERRRSIKKLESGPFPDHVRQHVLEAIRHTPAAYNQPPWQIVLIENRRHEFWAMFESAVRSRLHGDQLQRHLTRIENFRAAVAVAVVYEDLSVAGSVQAAWRIAPEDANDFVQQALGMVQLAIWLSLVGDGLSTSLQHWTWLAGPEIDAFLSVNSSAYKLTAVMPIGYAAETPQLALRPEIDSVIHAEQFGADPE